MHSEAFQRTVQASVIDILAGVAIREGSSAVLDKSWVQGAKSRFMKLRVQTVWQRHN